MNMPTPEILAPVPTSLATRADNRPGPRSPAHEPTSTRRRRRPGRRATTGSTLTGARRARPLALEALGVEVIFGIPAARSLLPSYYRVRLLGPHTSWSGTSRAPGTKSSPPRLRAGTVRWRVHGDVPAGATNLVNAVADAYLDSVPLVRITGGAMCQEP